MKIDLSKLPTEWGWDSYGGRPTTKEAKATVQQINFVPLSNGGLRVDFNNEEAVVEINEDGQITMVYWESPK